MAMKSGSMGYLENYYIEPLHNKKAKNKKKNAHRTGRQESQSSLKLNMYIANQEKLKQNGNAVS